MTTMYAGVLRGFSTPPGHWQRGPSMDRYCIPDRSTRTRVPAGGDLRHARQILRAFTARPGKGPVSGRSRLGHRFQRVNGRNRFWFGPRHGCRIVGARNRRNGGNRQPPWSSNLRLVAAATPCQRSPTGRPFNAQALAAAVNVGGVVTTPKGFGGRVTRAEPPPDARHEPVARRLAFERALCAPCAASGSG